MTTLSEDVDALITTSPADPPGPVVVDDEDAGGAEPDDPQAAHTNANDTKPGANNDRRTPTSLARRSGRRWIVSRYSMAPVGRSTRKTEAPQDRPEPLGSFGRYAGPATLILSSLAEGAKHGYALTKDIEVFAGVRLAPGTLYEALSRLEGQGLIEAVESSDRRRPYRLTAGGAAALRTHLDAQRRVADLGLRRLAGSWG